MSAFPKILWPIVVPTGGWDFGFNDGGAKVATIPAGTYVNIFEIAEELRDQMDAVSAVNFVVEVDQIGTVTIDGDAAWNTAWGTTDADCSACFGFNETEAVVATVLTSTNQHLYGWYPGLVSWGRTIHRGTGFARRFGFKPTWPVTQTISGNGEARTIRPTNPSRESPFELDVIAWTEYDDAARGLMAWWNACVSSTFYVFPDRAIGTVATWDAGTLVQNTDYYIASLIDGVVRDRDVPPLYVSVSAEFHREP